MEAMQICRFPLKVSAVKRKQQVHFPLPLDRFYVSRHFFVFYHSCYCIVAMLDFAMLDFVSRSKKLNKRRV
jgi:hypothetical protein